MNSAAWRPDAIPSRLALRYVFLSLPKRSLYRLPQTRPNNATSDDCNLTTAVRLAHSCDPLFIFFSSSLLHYNPLLPLSLFSSFRMAWYGRPVDFAAQYKRGLTASRKALGSVRDSIDATATTAAASTN